MLNHNREPQKSSENYASMWLTLAFLNLWVLCMFTRSLLCAMVTLFDHCFQHTNFPFSTPWSHQRWYLPLVLFQLMPNFYFICHNGLMDAVLKIQSEHHSTTSWAAAAAQCQPRDPAPPRSVGGCLRWTTVKHRLRQRIVGMGSPVSRSRSFLAHCAAPTVVSGSLT